METRNATRERLTFPQVIGQFAPEAHVPAEPSAGTAVVQPLAAGAAANIITTKKD
jgi:hypothetical protein